MSDRQPELCTCTAIRQAARHVSQFYDTALAPVSLGVNQYSILAKMARAPSISVQDLARRLVMDRSTLGHLLRPLEGRGLVRMAVSDGDRRSRGLTLTDAGRALVADAQPLWEAAQSRFDAAFGSEAAVDLRRALRRVTATALRPAPSHTESQHA